MRSLGFLTLLTTLLAATGCEMPVSKNTAAPAPKPQTTTTPAPMKTEPAKTPEPKPTELVQAKPGVGEKGQGYGNDIITVAPATYFRVQERVAFEVKIPQALNLYKANNDNKGPATHEEFMEKIIKPNGIELPKLLPHEEYVYVPEQEQLMIKKPAKK